MFFSFLCVWVFFYFFFFFFFFWLLFIFLILTEGCVGNPAFSPPPLSGLGTSKISLTSRSIQAELHIYLHYHNTILNIRRRLGRGGLLEKGGCNELLDHFCYFLHERISCIWVVLAVDQIVSLLYIVTEIFLEKIYIYINSEFQLLRNIIPFHQEGMSLFVLVPSFFKIHV